MLSARVVEIHQMEPVKRKRAFLPKVKTGCSTCKIRKVKCDETKPACHRCTSTGRTCPGYQPAPGGQVDHSMSAWLDSDAEKRSFDFFLTRAGQRLGGFFNSPFWSREVLQAAISYPSIRHLVVALGAAYEKFEHRETDRLSESASVKEDEMRFALQQCNQSIRHIAGSSSPSNDQSAETMCCILTASILFATFAILQGHFLQAIEHVRSGLRILESLQRLRLGTNASPFPVPVTRLRSILTSLYSQARAMINDEARAEWDSHDPLVSNIEPVARFHCLADAQSHVEALFHNTLAFLQRTELSPPVTPEQTAAVVAQHRMLCSALRSSCGALDAFVARGADGTDEKAIAILRLYHTLLSVRLGTNVFREDEREGAMDDFEQHLVQMLEYCRLILRDDDGSEDTTAQGPICCSGLGVVMPLHMVAARCRNPAVRQKAVDLLLQTRRREGLWDSVLVGKAVSTTIELEQRAGLVNDLKVPGDARIREVKVSFEGERSVRLVFLTVGQWKNKESGTQRIIQW